MAVERELLRGIDLMKQGSEEGFNILYMHTYDYVYHRAKFIMKNEEDACDLTQETFIQAYKGIAALEDAANIYAWLGGIVYRQGMRIFRKKKELLVDEEAESIFTDIASTDKDTSPEESAETKAAANVVMSMIEELPELQRAAVMAFYYDNMKIDEIAERFECSSNTIKSRLNYAKKALKEKVQEHEKKYRYKLCSLSPAVMLFAFRSLFAGAGYALRGAAVQGIYNGACGAVGLVPSAVMAAGSTTAGAGSAAGAAGAGAAEGSVIAHTAGVATKAGLSFAAKIGIMVAAVATTAAVVTGTVLITNSNKGKPEPPAQTIVDDNTPDDGQIPGGTNEADTEPVDLYGWETLEGEYTDDSNLYTVKICNVKAKSPAEEDVGFDIIWICGDESFMYNTRMNNNEIYLKAFRGEPKFNTTGSSEEEKLQNDWEVFLTHRADGSFSLDFRITDAEGRVADLQSPDEVVLKKQGDTTADTQGQAKEYTLEDGHYTYYRAPGYSLEKGGYGLFILNLQEKDDGYTFDMDFSILSDNCNEVDVPQGLTPMEMGADGRAYFEIETVDWKNQIKGVLYVDEQNNLMLEYEVTYKNPNMEWSGEYPLGTEEPILLNKE